MRDKAAFELSRRRRQQKAEGDASGLCAYGVVEAMGLDTRSPKPIAPVHGEAEAFVDEAVVKEEVGGAVRGDADPYGEPPAIDINAEPNGDDGGKRKDDSEKVVQLEKALPRFVMALVPAPERPMHQITVGDEREPFHSGKRRKEERDFGEGGPHRVSVAAPLRKASLSYAEN